PARGRAAELLPCPAGRRRAAGQGARRRPLEALDEQRMKLADFDRWARSELDAVEAALDAWVPVDAPAGLGLAMRYGVLDGGKRLRPLLVLAANQAVGGLRDAAIRAACAV